MERHASEEGSDLSTDDAFNMICGDLGLGENSRSSASLRYELEVLTDISPLSLSFSLSSFGNDASKNQACCTDTLNEKISRCRTTSSEDSCESKTTQLNVREKAVESSINKQKQVTGFSLSLSKTKSKSTKNGQFEENESDCQEKFPTYADVPYGTSFRQQKKLFEQNLGNIRKKQSCYCGAENADNTDNEGGKKYLSNDEIDKRLLSAMEEVEELKQDLEICRQRLEAKYHAINILKRQAEENSHEFTSSELRAKETNLKLAEEVNKLQFELQWRESSFLDSQQTWAQRFDRVCQDNSLLSAQLEARSEELRRANSHRMALRRERDELLALLDIKDRKRYEQSHGHSEEDFCEFSTTELAVLGACRCREPHGTEPCGCAFAAANLTKEIYRLREECKILLQRREEAYKTVDAYRLAFEEQLLKTRVMTQQLAAMATSASRSVKAKAAIRFLLSVLADDEYPAVRGTCGTPTKDVHNPKSLEELTLPELVTLLTEMLQEKKEALFHQKLAGQLLSVRLQETERKLKSLSEADGTVIHN